MNTTYGRARTHVRTVLTVPVLLEYRDFFNRCIIIIDFIIIDIIIIRSVLLCVCVPVL